MATLQTIVPTTTTISAMATPTAQPIISSALSVTSTVLYPIYSVLLAAVTFITSSILAILNHTSPIPLLLYILSPALVLLHVLFDVFVFTPYAYLLALADILYPLYVFCGAAALCAVFLGYCGRGMISLLYVMLLGTNAPGEPQRALKGPPASTKAEPQVARKEKGRQRRRVKVED